MQEPTEEKKQKMTTKTSFINYIPKTQQRDYRQNTADGSSSESSRKMTDEMRA